MPVDVFSQTTSSFGQCAWAADCVANVSTPGVALAGWPAMVATAIASARNEGAEQ
jgi:hypothetical protein